MIKITLHVFHFFDETVKAINFYIEKKNYFVSVKRIRKYHNIDPSDRSRINFISRNLQVLADNKIIERTKKPKGIYSYKLPKEKILIRYKNGYIDHISTNSREKKEKLYSEKSNHNI